MSQDFIDDLIQALKRVLPPDAAGLKEILIVSGMPAETENFRYLNYNRHNYQEPDRRFEFIAVAVLNNRRADIWGLEGHKKTISQWVFNPRWNRNPLDIFLNNLRCSRDMIRIIRASPCRYSLLGILKTEDRPRSGLLPRRVGWVQPVVAIPGIDARGRETVETFEAANKIRRTRI